MMMPTPLTQDNIDYAEFVLESQKTLGQMETVTVSLSAFHAGFIAGNEIEIYTEIINIPEMGALLQRLSYLFCGIFSVKPWVYGKFQARVTAVWRRLNTTTKRVKIISVQNDHDLFFDEEVGL